MLPERPKAGEVQAAAMLQTYLGLATGAVFARCSEKAIPAGLKQIHLGDTRAALAVPLDIPPARYSDLRVPNVNGYLVRTLSPQRLLIRGVTPRPRCSARWACCGAGRVRRRYRPGEPGGLGDVVPKAARLELPEVSWPTWPYFISRTMSGCDERGPQTAAGRAAGCTTSCA